MKKVYLFLVVCVILLCSFGVRLKYAIGTQQNYKHGLGIADDSICYHNIANNLLKGHGFSATPGPGSYNYSNAHQKPVYKPAITRGPTYPVFLFLIYKIFGKHQEMGPDGIWPVNWNIVRVVQCVLDTLTCLLVFVLIRCTYSRSVYPAIIGSLLYAFSAGGIYYSRAILSEVLTTFLLMVFISLFIQGVKLRKGYLFSLSGIVFGFLILGRMEYSLFAGFLLLYLLAIYWKSTVKVVKIWLIFFLSVLFTVLPWTIRNHVVFDRFIVSYGGNFGYNLFHGVFMKNYENDSRWRIARDSFKTNKEWMHVNDLRNKVIDHMYTGEAEIFVYDKQLKEIALKKIKEDPIVVGKSWVKKIPALWSNNFFKLVYGPKADFNYLYMCLLFAFLAMFGNTKSERQLLAPLALLFIYVNLLYLPLYSESRYGVPVLPAIICLTSIGIFKAIVFLKIKTSSSHK